MFSAWVQRPGRKEPREGRKFLNVSITDSKVFDRLSVSGPHSPPTLNGEGQQSLAITWILLRTHNAPASP